MAKPPHKITIIINTCEEADAALKTLAEIGRAIEDSEAQAEKEIEDIRADLVVKTTGCRTMMLAIEASLNAWAIGRPEKLEGQVDRASTSPRRLPPAEAGNQAQARHGKHQRAGTCGKVRAR